MFNKWKNEINDKINEKFKKKANEVPAATEESTASESANNQNSDQVRIQQAQAQQITFNLNNMADYSQEELQQVIRKYDAGLQKIRTSLTEKTEKISSLEQQLAQGDKKMNEIMSLSEMQAEENKTLKQHVHAFNQENTSLKNLVSVLEADVSKIEDLEAQVDQYTQLYEKEKDLNRQLLNSATNDAEGDDDTDESGEDGIPNVRISGTEQIFRAKFEAEQKLNFKLQDELRDCKAQMNQREAAIEQQIKLKDRALKQFKEQQDQNAALTKLMEALSQEIQMKEEEILKIEQRLQETEAEKNIVRTQFSEVSKQLASFESDSGKQRQQNDTQVCELMERIRGKELVIDQNANEMRQLQSKLKSQETSIAYFKRQVQELEESLEQEKSEKQTLKREMHSYNALTVDQIQTTSSGGTQNQGQIKQDGFEQLKALLSAATTIGTAAKEVTHLENQEDVKPQLDERDAQLKELKEELMRLSEDYSALSSAKSQLEAKNQEAEEKSSELLAQIQKMEEDAYKMKLTIKELEKRRDQAIKEIRSLKHQIQKKEKISQASTSEAAAISDLNSAAVKDQ